MNAYNRNAGLAAYQRVSAHGGVAGADPHGLVMMLMDAAVERMTAALGCIERGEVARKAKLLHNCVNIIGELRGSLDMSKGGPIAANLGELYDYMCRRLLTASSENRGELLDEVSTLLHEIRGAWLSIAPKPLTKG